MRLRLEIRSDLPAAALAVALALAPAGCGGKSKGPSGPTPEEIAAGLTDEGWGLFEAGSRAEAAAKFRDALAASATYSEAQNGLGWSLALLDSLPSAFDAFGAAISNGHGGPDPRAGRALVGLEIAPVAFLSVVNDAAIALALSPRYAFAHDGSVDWRDLRLVRAQSYYELGRLAESAAEVESLGVTPPDPVDPTYADSLLAQIERLGNSLGPPALRSVP